MKTLRIHLIWSVVSVVAAAAWGQHFGRSRETEFRERERVLQVKVVQATTAAAAQAPTIVTTAAPVAAAAPAALLPTLDVPTAEYELVQALDRPTVEELRKLIQDGNEVWRAYQVIQRMAKGPVKTQLTRELFEHPDARVRRNAVHLLREVLGNEAAAPIFQEALRKDPDAAVREQVAQYLGYEEAPGSVEALLQAFQKDEPAIQLASAASLSQLGQHGPASQMVPQFAPMLDNPDGAVRRQAVESLGRLRSPQSLSLLTRALRDTNGDVRLEALNSLWDYTEDTPVLSLVEPLVNDPVVSVRDAAKDMVEQLKKPKDEE